jgi:hypothetical protein
MNGTVLAREIAKVYEQHSGVQPCGEVERFTVDFLAARGDWLEEAQLRELKRQVRDELQLRLLQRWNQDRQG